MNFIRACAIIFACLTVGELLVYVTGVKFPSSIIGMVLLTALLHFKVLQLHWVKAVADFFVGNLMLFFIPSGVALMLYADIIKAEFIPIVVATLVSTLLVLVVTGWVHQLFRRKR